MAKMGRPIKWTEEKCNKIAEEFEAWMQLPDSIWFKSFFVEKKLDYNHFLDLSYKYPRLREAFEHAREWQTGKLLTGGLAKKYSPEIVKLILYNTAGWSDKKQLSGDSESPLKVILEEVDGTSKDL